MGASSWLRASLPACHCSPPSRPAAAAPACLGGPALPSCLHGCPLPPLAQLRTPGSAPVCPSSGQSSWKRQGLALTIYSSLPFSTPGSKSSGSTRSAGGSSRRALGREEHRGAGAGGSGSESDHTAPSRVGGSSWRERPASQLSRGSSPHSQASAAAPGLPPLHPLTKAYSVVGGPPGGPPVRELATVPPELTGSRQSFQKAMGNPCEFFVDIM